MMKQPSADLKAQRVLRRRTMNERVAVDATLTRRVARIQARVRGRRSDVALAMTSSNRELHVERSGEDKGLDDHRGTNISLTHESSLIPLQNAENGNRTLWSSRQTLAG